jgi:hypothetical protein
MSHLKIMIWTHSYNRYPMMTMMMRLKLKSHTLAYQNNDETFLGLMFGFIMNGQNGGETRSVQNNIYVE